MDAAGVQPVGAYGLFSKADLTGATCTRLQCSSAASLASLAWS